MKFRFELIARTGWLALLLLLGGAIISEAQAVTNLPPVVFIAGNTSTNNPPGLLRQTIAFGWDKIIDFLHSTTLLGQPLEKYLSFLIYVVLAFYATKFLDFIINSWLKRLAAKTETKYDDLVLDLLRGPVKIVSFVVLLNIGLNVFDWPAAAEKYFSRGLVIIVACSVTYVIIKIVDLLLGLWRERVVLEQDKVFASQLFPIFSKVARSVIIVAAILLTADNLNIEIKTLLAGLSVGGLALGLAAQDTVANMFGAVAILLDKPFHIGDRVKVESVEGFVESIGLRSTRVRNLDGHLVTLPNKLMGNAIITNITRRPTIKTEMNLGLTYDTPVEKVRPIFISVLMLGRRVMLVMMALPMSLLGNVTRCPSRLRTRVLRRPMLSTKPSTLSTFTRSPM